MSTWTYVMVPANVFNLRLSILELGVYTALCSFADAKTGKCFPSLQTLAQRAGTSRATVIRVLRSLKSRGLITSEQRTAETGSPKSNLYYLPDVEARREKAESEAVPHDDQGSITETPGVVAECNQGSCRAKPELESFNNNHENKNQPNNQGRSVEERCLEWIIRELRRRGIPVTYADGILSRAQMRAHTSLAGYLERVGLREFLDEYEAAQHDAETRVDELYGLAAPVSAASLHELHRIMEVRLAEAV